MQSAQSPIPKLIEFTDKTRRIESNQPKPLKDFNQQIELQMNSIRTFRETMHLRNNNQTNEEKVLLPGNASTKSMPSNTESKDGQRKSGGVKIESIRIRRDAVEPKWAVLPSNAGSVSMQSVHGVVAMPPKNIRLAQWMEPSVMFQGKTERKNYMKIKYSLFFIGFKLKMLF